jgi:ribosomal subunit interface protein
MTKPLQVVFRGLERSDAVEEHVREKVAKLTRLHPQIMSCRVTIELPHKHHTQGKLFDVRIDLSVPGRELVVNREQGNEDMYMALRDAFDAAKRQLAAAAPEQRGDGTRIEGPAA